jgi:hypothetical protein
MNQNLARGVFLVFLALAFGVPSLSYNVGTLARSGPGLFPALVSGLLLLIGLITVGRSFLVKPVPMALNPRNIAIIVASLCGFALVSSFVNMTAGIVFMVFCAALAGTNYSWKRNLKLSIALLIVAFGFQKLLGLNLPLY